MDRTFDTLVIETIEKQVARRDCFEKRGNLSKFKQRQYNKAIEMLRKHKIIAPYIAYTEERELVHVEFDKVHAVIEHLYDEIYFRLGSNEDLRVLIGRNWMDYLKIETVEQYDLRIPLHMDGPRGRVYKDMRVTVVPRMEGVYLIKE